MQVVTVRVPATSANLGPGFDCLGVALSLYASVRFEVVEGEGLTIEGCSDAYKNDDNLAVTAFRGLFWRLGKRAPGLKVTIDSQIPATRGLGSSSAMLCAGALAANAFLGMPYTNGELLNILTEFEGHPDNVTPALFGGLTAATIHANKPYFVRYSVHPELKFCALTPGFELSTSSARMALPASVSHKDAAYNVSRMAILLKALETGDEEALSFAFSDRLHQPYREHMIADYKTIRLDAMASGAIGMYLSGAGPTLMCVYKDQDFPRRVERLVSEIRNDWRVLPLAIDPDGAKWEEG